MKEWLKTIKVEHAIAFYALTVCFGYLIFISTSHVAIELSSAAQYPGSAGRVVRIYNATSFTYQIAGVTRTARRCDVVWTSANNPSFYFY